MALAIRTSPAYDAHVRAGAVFREKNGWHRVDYFQTNESLGHADRRPLGPGGDLWSAAVEAEHRTVRQSVGLFDLTSFGKLAVSGPGAPALLEHLCSNRVTRGVGTVTYTQMLNTGGGVVADVTVTQLGSEEFFVVTGTSALEHDLDWVLEHAHAFPPVAVTNVTSAWSCFGVWGPLARDVVSTLTAVPLESAAFPYMTSQPGVLAGAPVRLTRLTFVGELGWEIYVPTEYGRFIWQRLADAVATAGGLRCGYRAIDSLRAEKGYLYLGADLTPDRPPTAAGLGPFVRTDKEFVGRDAVLAAGDPGEVLRCFVLDGRWYQLSGAESVRFPGGPTVPVTSGGMGYTVAAAIGFAYLPAGVVSGDAVEVQVADEWVPGHVVDQPLYDPSGARIRA
jgi:heterotetrameric sarcosine oxidase gamma subunit